MALEMFSCSVQWSIASFEMAIGWKLEFAITNVPLLLATFGSGSLATKLNMWDTRHFPVREFRSSWSLQAALAGGDYWIIAYSPMQFPFLEYTGLYSLSFFGRKTQKQQSTFFLLSLAQFKQWLIGALGLCFTFSLRGHFFLVLVVSSVPLEPFSPLSHGMCLWFLLGWTQYSTTPKTDR